MIRLGDERSRRMQSMKVSTTRRERSLAGYSTKPELRAHPGAKIKISYTRSRYVYENKENIDKVTAKSTDIFDHRTTIERHLDASPDKQYTNCEIGASKTTARADASKTRERCLGNRRSFRRRPRSCREDGAPQLSMAQSPAHRAPVQNGRAENAPVTGYPEKLLKIQGRDDLIARGWRFLLKHQDRYGIWCSTQATSH